MNPPISVAIVGAGIGAQHLSAYLALARQYKVCILCDINLDRARQVRGDRQDIAIESEISNVLADPHIDLVDICLPPHLHFQACIAALQQGKHVVCEKPLVTSLKDCDALAAQAAKSGRVLSPVFQYRYGPGTARLKALIDAGLAGKPYVASIETHWDRRADYYAVPWRGTWQGEQGGAVLGHAIHNHDLLCSVFGAIKKVSAMTSTRVNNIETEDCASLSFQMENGALASSSVSLGAAGDTTRLRFCFEHLTAESGSNPYAPAEDEWTFLARDLSSADQDLQQRIDACVAGVSSVYAGYQGFFMALAEALQGRPGREVTLEDGRRSLELVSAIYYAAANSKVVELPLESNNPVYTGWCPEELT